MGYTDKNQHRCIDFEVYRVGKGDKQKSREGGGRVGKGEAT